MARILYFQIKGLAGKSRAVEHTLRDDINVFWGFNGSGKTSLLKILHSALGNEATSLLRVPFTSAEVHIFDDRSDKTYVRILEKSELDDTEMAQLALDIEEENVSSLRFQSAAAERLAHHRVPRWHTKPKPETMAESIFRHGYLPISRVSEVRGRRGRARAVAELVDETAFDKLFAEQIQVLWQEYNQRALMQIRTSQERGLARILSSVLSTRNRPQNKTQVPVEDAQEAYQIVKTFFANQRLGSMLHLGRDSFVKNFESNALVQEVVAELVEVQRGIDLAQEPQHRIEQLLGELYTGGKRVELHGREVTVTAGKHQIPLESLSSGEKQLLQLLLECLAAGANPVIIDEPELSLHVDWQNRLVRCMTTVNDSAQLIMATHSPEVMAKLNDNTVIEL